MYLVNKSSKLEPVNKVYKIREKSQSLLDHPRINFTIRDYHFFEVLKMVAREITPNLMYR